MYIQIIDGCVQHYPKCLHKVLALRIVLHSPIKLSSANPVNLAKSEALSFWEEFTLYRDKMLRLEQTDDFIFDKINVALEMI